MIEQFEKTALHRQKFLVAIVPLLLAVAIGAFTTPSGFVYDDRILVHNDDRLEPLSAIPGLFADNWWGSENDQPLYRPLTLSMFVVERALFTRNNPWPYHAVNAVLYGVCSGLIGLLVLRVGAGPPGALAAGLLFACHPIHTEPVTTIVGQGDLMAGIMTILALLLFAGTDRSWSRAFLIAATFLAGMLFKESAIVIVPALALLPLFQSPSRAPLQAIMEGVRTHIRTWLLLAIAFLGWAILRFSAVGSLHGTVDPFDNVLVLRGEVGRIAGAFAVSAFYHVKFLIPWPLSSDYSFRAIVPPSDLFSGQSLFGVVCWAALFVAAFALRRRAPVAGLGLVIYAFALLPVANIFFPIGTIFAERLLFVPSIGGCIGIAALLGPILRANDWRKAMGWTAVIAISLLGSFASIIRFNDWRDEESLGLSLLRTQPQSYRSRSILANVYLEQANHAPPDREDQLLRKARTYLEQTIEILPGHLYLQLNLADVYERLDMPIEMRRQAALLNNRWPRADQVLALQARIATNDGDLQRALSIILDGLAEHPDSTALRKWHSIVQTSIERQRQTAAVLQQRIKEDSGNADAIEAYCQALFAIGDYQSIVALIDRLLKPKAVELFVHPSAARYAAALELRGVARSRLGEHVRAIEDLRAAIHSEPGRVKAQVALAESLLALGRLVEADATIDNLDASVVPYQVEMLRAELRAAKVGSSNEAAP